MSGRTSLLWAGILGATGVLAGAFGAHGLEKRIPADLLEIWNTGAQYQIYHALALLGVAILLFRGTETRALRAAGVCFLMGVILFSGSLYVLALTGTRWWGAVTPFGGVGFVAGWLCLGWAGWKGNAINF
jgi:uncharacterized membrane protein YgdD (TMEM256/DUF423 family)